MSGKVNFALLLVTALVVAVFSALFVPQYFRQSPGIRESDQTSVPLSDAVKLPESLQLSDIRRLRQMLQEEQFIQLNAVLEGYQKRFERDEADEVKVFEAYGAFGVTLPEYETRLRKWVAATPDAYQPYLAGAEYYYKKGWESRGTKWAKETSGEQFEAMERFFDKAEENIAAALRIKPNLMVAYYLLIGIYNTRGDDDGEDRVIQRSFRLFPASFLLKSYAMWSKEPRWGGSYEQMRVLAKKADRFTDKNPRIPVLYGFIYYDKARNLAEQNRYDKALEMLNKALEFGDDWSFYYERAKLYHYHFESYDKALADIDRSIELRPLLVENRLMRSKIYFAKNAFSKALDDLLAAEKITPGDPETAAWKKWAAVNLMSRGHRLFKTDPGKAVWYYDRSLAWDNDSFDAHYWRGEALVKQEAFSAALSDFLAAVKINPIHFDSYRMIDYLYARERRWDDIIDYWTQFISLQPNNAAAYYERSGTYYHRGDMQRAVRDLKTACNLGNEAACRRYDRMTK